MKILEKILEDKQHRKQLVKQFQDQIWNGDVLENKDLSELAYDLDYYEPDEKIRAQDPSYYGDERLEKEVESVLEKIRSYSDKLT